MNPSDEDSVRSRAAAGLRYFLFGSVLCAAALLMLHAGITSTPHRGLPFPTELLAGLGGIVAFIGLLQLLIAWILKMRRHQ
jgi:hypothetical protein